MSLRFMADHGVTDFIIRTLRHEDYDPTG